MRDRPIIFSAPMVRALLDGRKTQTRRVLKPLKSDGPGYVTWPIYARKNEGMRRCGSSTQPDRAAPYAVGDKLWVREAFVVGHDIDDELGRPVGEQKVWFRATDSRLTWFDPDTESTLDNPPWKPSIHMPRWASRLTLLVTDVRVQLLQEISEADAKAEGVWRDTNGWVDYLFPGTQCCPTAAQSFCTLWDSLHGPGEWDVNPWVAAISFSVHIGNIDTLEPGHA
ncbi:hypothetical protein [Pannonibacter sp. SL95]|uniref:hypothetical protein n=1 Tax=Pannonibacter sp. SL95 TaxID=2995153 RepID=UPI0022726A95|nr:hypothetical protein [Pannonibacter sp. SL95]MCY1704518.1 hypothetical protein [Pannonibacter sp. SL95]MCY1707295.1 hypothetical protein [Pannonibacter sp. SL95]MCY1709020.1 hypothetical protein [Pannonibacter sp. SL95]